MITRGTTPKLKFTIPFDVNEIETGFITFSQYDKVVFDKVINDWETNGNEIKVMLSQEDTLKLTERVPVSIQIRLKTKDGDAHASKIVQTEVGRVLKDGAI